jgi:hypothetical protein
VSETFRFGCLTLPYLPQREGEHIGERRIEVPIARAWLWQQEVDVVEVGAVMPYYGSGYRLDTVDPYDPHPGVAHRMDAEEFDFTGRKVLSLSTIEHIGTKEYEENPDIFKARRVLRKIVEQSSAFLITIPLGFHPPLDAMLESSRGVPMRFMRQVDARNLWEPCSPDWCAKYNEPLPYANVVAFLSNSFDWIGEEA